MERCTWEGVPICHIEERRTEGLPTPVLVSVPLTAVHPRLGERCVHVHVCASVCGAEHKTVAKYKQVVVCKAQFPLSPVHIR